MSCCREGGYCDRCDLLVDLPGAYSLDPMSPDEELTKALLCDVEPGERPDVVVVAVSAPHRDAAFAAARFGIDAVKATVPIWKRETWAGGSSWGREAQHLTEVEQVAGSTS